MIFPAVAAAGVAVALVGAIADRALKIYFTTYPAAGGVVVAGWLRLRAAANPNLAFSLPFPAIMTVALSGIALALFVWWWLTAARRGQAVATLALTLVVTGAASNWVDRIAWGHVVDYLDVPWFTVFNLADAMITAGVLLLIGRELVGRRKQHSNNPSITSRKKISNF